MNVKLNCFAERLKPKSRIYHQWIAHNHSSTIFQIFQLGLVASLILLPFDYVFFGDEALEHYTWFRVASILVFTGGLLTLRRFKVFVEDQRQRLLIAGLGLLSMILFNSMYVYFLESAPEPHKDIIQAAMFMNVFACNMLVYRLWGTSHVLFAGLALLFNLAPLASNENAPTYQSLFFWCLIMIFFFGVQRRDFITSLEARFKSFLHQYPPKVAEAMTVLGNESEYLERFRPQNRPCLCLCADWRSFQEMASSHSPEEIAQLIEKSHEVLLKLVYRNIPNESFHADWSADEFFLMIYSETNDKNEILNGTMRLLQDIMDQFYDEIRAVSSNLVPTIDIGVAYGDCILGLLGPKNMKKLTSVGSIGGRAKRLETEAKTIREERALNARAMVLAVDFDVFFFLCERGPHWAQGFEDRRAKAKNIKNDAIYLFVSGDETLLEAPKLMKAS